MKDKKRIVPVVFILCAVLMAGAINVWATPCEGMLTTEEGQSVCMKCHYLIAAGNGIALLCVAFAVHILRKKVIPTIPTVMLGILSVSMTFSCMLGIGICPAEGMACHMTALWMRIIGTVLVLCGIYSAVDFEKQL